VAAAVPLCVWMDQLARHIVWECWYSWIEKKTYHHHHHLSSHTHYVTPFLLLRFLLLLSPRRGATSWRQLKVTISHWTIKWKNLNPPRLLYPFKNFKVVLNCDNTSAHRDHDDDEMSILFLFLVVERKWRILLVFWSRSYSWVEANVADIFVEHLGERVLLLSNVLCTRAERERERADVRYVCSAALGAKK
jgi:hypothetical protein